MHRKHQLLRIEHAKIDQKELLRMRQLSSAPPPLATLGVTAAPWHATLKRGSVSTTEAGPAPVVVYVKLGSADGAARAPDRPDGRYELRGLTLASTVAELREEVRARARARAQRERTGETDPDGERGSDATARGGGGARCVRGRRAREAHTARALFRPLACARSQIEAELGVPACCQRLLHHGSELADGRATMLGANVASATIVVHRKRGTHNGGYGGDAPPPPAVAAFSRAPHSARFAAKHLAKVNEPPILARRRAAAEPAWNGRGARAPPPRLGDGGLRADLVYLKQSAPPLPQRASSRSRPGL